MDERRHGKIGGIAGKGEFRWEENVVGNGMR
jgi:hypothetical protein